MNNKVEFVSYNGRYPILCSGTLVLRINGELVSFKDCLVSGGSVTIEKNGIENVETGEWSVDVPEQYKALKSEISAVVNANVEYGCCGGCV